MKGTRSDATEKGHVPRLELGGYGKDADGEWWCRPPESKFTGKKCGAGILSDHTVTEHEDGTITVSPSILMPGFWHGYLERGVWREVE